MLSKSSKEHRNNGPGDFSFVSGSEKQSLPSIDSLVEDDKSRDDVQESVKRWWKHIHPADRPIARKHLLSVLSKSNATLAAITGGLNELQDFEVHAPVRTETVPRLHTMPAPTTERMKASV